MSKKESALDLAKFIDKGIRVKLAGGREGEGDITGCKHKASCGASEQAMRQQT